MAKESREKSLEKERKKAEVEAMLRAIVRITDESRVSALKKAELIEQLDLYRSEGFVLEKKSYLTNKAQRVIALTQAIARYKELQILQAACSSSS